MSASQPWQVDAWGLDSDLAKIEQQWGPLRRILEDPVLFERSAPEVSGWSCGQHAGHVVLIATTIAGRVESNLAEPDHDRDAPLAEIAQRILSGGRFTRGVAKSPPDGRPDDRTREEFLTLLHPAIESWERLRARAEDLAACPDRTAHFALGPLSGAEWVRFCAIHSAHHLNIVRDIAGDAAVSVGGPEQTR